MSQETSLKAPKDMTFEEAMIELETVVRRLEEGQVPLDQAIASYERGTALKEHCDSVLKKARLKIDEIYQAKDGSLEAKPSDLQSALSDITHE